MKKLVVGALLSLGFLALPGVAQEKLSREDALKFALVACGNLKEMINTPIPTDPDVKRPVVLKDGEYGGMLLPEGKLSAETFAGLDKTPKAVGQIWMSKLTFLKGDNAVSGSKLRTVRVNVEGGEHPVTCSALAARKNAEGGLELVVYGKSAEPLLSVPLKSVSNGGAETVDMSGERNDNGATLKLVFLGKYEATLSVTDPDLY